MKKFTEFLNEQRQLLLCGGNVSVRGIAAEKIDIRQVPRQFVATEIRKAMLALNTLFRNKYKKPIWTNTDVLNGYAFNGSSEFLFDPNVTDEFLLKHKPSFGDIDLTVPAEHKEALGALLDSIKGKQITPHVRYIGNNKEDSDSAGHQYNCIFQLTSLPIDKKTLNVQIDLELTEYEGDKPSEFTKFAHSSHISDISAGVKGVIHKFLLTGLVGGSNTLTPSDVTFFTKAATAEKPRVAKVSEKGISKFAFSVDRGVRQRLIPVMGPDGKQLVHDGKPVWKERDTDQSEFTTKISDIASHIFGDKFDQADLPKLWSAVGIIELMKKYLDSKRIQQVFDKVVDKCFAPGAQHLDRTIEGDQAVKKVAIDMLLNAFPSIDQTALERMWQQYYEGFVERQKKLDQKRAAK